MGARLYEIPIGSSGPLGFDRVPGGALTMTMYGPMITNSFDGSNGVGWTVGVSDMERRFGLASGVSQSGLFSPQFDGSGNAWNDDQTSGNGYGNVDHRLDGTAVLCFAGSHAPSRLGDIAATCDRDAFGRNGDTVRALTALVLGNRCVTQVAAFNLNTSTGSQSVTGVGFQPDLVILLGAHPIPSQNNGCRFEIGAFDANGNQWAVAERSVYLSGPSFLGGLLNQVTRRSRFVSDACLLHIGAQGSAQATTVAQRAEFVSMDADGFTINLTAAGLDSAGNPSRCVYMAFGLLDEGDGLEVGVGIQGDPTIDTEFAPEALLFFSNESDVETEVPTAVLAYGAADDTINRGYRGGGASGSVGGGPPASFGSSSASRAIHWGAARATVTLTEDGADLDWEEDDALNRKFGWIAVTTSDGLPTTPEVETGNGIGLCGSGYFAGVVDPNGEEVTVRFVYGPTSDLVPPFTYASFVNAGTVDGDDPVDVFASVGGLTIGQTYYFRIVSYHDEPESGIGGTPVTGFANEQCSTFGEEESFVVQPCDVGVTGLTDPTVVPFQVAADPS